MESLLARFGIVEIALSDLALCQSQLVIKKNPGWSSCTLELNGKGLIMGWKEPQLSLFLFGSSTRMTDDTHVLDASHQELALSYFLLQS